MKTNSHKIESHGGLPKNRTFMSKFGNIGFLQFYSVFGLILWWSVSKLNGAPLPLEYSVGVLLIIAWMIFLFWCRSIMLILFLCLSETWLKPCISSSITPALFKVQPPVCNDRIAEHGGGVTSYIRDGLPCKPLPSCWHWMPGYWGKATS